MSDFPFSIPTTQPPSHFTLTFSQRVINGNQAGLMRVMPSYDSQQDIFFVNVPFSYKIIGMSLSLDKDSPTYDNKDYDFQLRTRPKDSATTTESALTSVGETLSFNNVLKSTSRSALFTNPQTITNEHDLGLRVDSTATSSSPEYGVILWCQTV